VASVQTRTPISTHCCHPVLPPSVSAATQGAILGWALTKKPGNYAGFWWSGKRDLNSRRSAWEADLLPNLPGTFFNSFGRMPTFPGNSKHIFRGTAATRCCHPLLPPMCGAGMTARICLSRVVCAWVGAGV